MVLFSYIITRLPILSYRPSCCDVLPAKLSIIKSLDAPYGDSLSRSVTNYSLFDYLGVQPVYYFRGGSLLSISSNKDTNSSTSINIISFLGLFYSRSYSNNFIQLFFYIIRLQLPLIVKLGFLNCFVFDFFNSLLLLPFVSSRTLLTHYFTDNNPLTDSLVLYKLLSNSSNISITQLQYSCVAFPNSIMISCADSVALFHPDFSKSFKYKSFGPTHAITVPYIFPNSRNRSYSSPFSID